MFNIRFFKKHFIFFELKSFKNLCIIRKQNNIALDLRLQKIKDISIYHSYLVFKYSYVRKVLELPSIKVRTRCKRRVLKYNNISNFFLKNNYSKANKYQLAEFYNVIWFIFFTYEWYITFFYNNKLKRNNHKKNVHFNHKELKYKKIVSHGSRTKKSKKNVKKKKDSSKEFNIGFYYLDTLLFFRKYLYYRQ